MAEDIKEKIQKSLKYLISECNDLLESTNAKKEEYRIYKGDVTTLYQVQIQTFNATGKNEHLTLDTILIACLVGTFSLLCQLIKRKFFTKKKEKPVKLSFFQYE